MTNQTDAQRAQSAFGRWRHEQRQLTSAPEPLADTSGLDDSRAARALARRAIVREFERQRQAIRDPERAKFVERCTVACFIAGTCGWRGGRT